MRGTGRLFLWRGRLRGFIVRGACGRWLEGGDCGGEGVREDVREDVLELKAFVKTFVNTLVKTF